MLGSFPPTKKCDWVFPKINYTRFPNSP